MFADCPPDYERETRCGCARSDLCVGSFLHAPANDPKPAWSPARTHERFHHRTAVSAGLHSANNRCLWWSLGTRCGADAAEIRAVIALSLRCGHVAAATGTSPMTGTTAKGEVNLPYVQSRARRPSLLGPSRLRAAIWLVLCTLLGLAGGGALALTGENVARATTTVLVSPLSGNAFSPDDPGSDLVNLNTEAQLVSSDAVGAMVARDEGDPTAMRDILAGVSVEVPANSQILEITATANSEQRAVSRSQKFSEEFLEYRRSKALNAANDRIERLQQQLDQTNTRLDNLTTQAQGTSSADRKSVLNQQIQTLSAYAVTLRTTLTETRSTSTFPGQVITPASESAGLAAGPLILLFGGAMFGAAVGALGALISGRARGRIRHERDADALGIPVVAHATQEELETLAGNMTDISTKIPDAVRQARSHVLHHATERPIHLAVAHAGPGPQLPSAGASLAVALVRAGVSTTIMDFTDETQSLTRWLGYTDSSVGGLAAALREGVNVNDRFHIELQEGLRLLPLGNPKEDFDDLISSPAMTRVIADLDKKNDCLILLMSMHPTNRSHELLTHFPNVLVQLPSEEVKATELAGFSSALNDGQSIGALFVTDDQSDSPRSRVPWRRGDTRSHK